MGKKKTTIEDHEREMKFMSNKPTWWIIKNLTETNPTYLANPEFAFGIVRKLALNNTLRLNHVMQFLTKHPAWSQVFDIGSTDEKLEELARNLGVKSIQMVNGKRTEVLEKRIQHIWRADGKATIEYMTDAGIKKEQIPLSCQILVRGKGAYDRRPFMAMSIDSCPISYQLFGKDEQKPCLIKNNDKIVRRKIATWKESTNLSIEDSFEKGQDIVSLLKGGGTVSNFL